MGGLSGKPIISWKVVFCSWNRKKSLDKTKRPIQEIEYKARNCFPGYTGVTWNAPKRLWRMYFARDGICICFWNAPKSNIIHFWWFSCFNIGHMLFSRNAPLFMFEDFEMPHFKCPSRFSNIKKWGISRKKHVIDFKTGKEPKMNMFDFGAFQKQMHIIWHHVRNISSTYFLRHFK